ncbi:uncharacterized protein LOC113146943 [Cyclospora cayetanensis]|uniref:Uncharacterized protein LOC113146943 n=1 Tax=Cyclospora cayetanensis TaxID=88456 RepID=A0A6P6RUQ6_9EIME|nr:uncharacterized protein LOC113146943 [Cyclospora cayetanensis]
MLLPNGASIAVTRRRARQQSQLRSEQEQPPDAKIKRLASCLKSSRPLRTALRSSLAAKAPETPSSGPAHMACAVHAAPHADRKARPLNGWRRGSGLDQKTEGVCPPNHCKQNSVRTAHAPARQLPSRLLKQQPHPHQQSLTGRAPTRQAFRGGRRLIGHKGCDEGISPGETPRLVSGAKTAFKEPRVSRQLLRTRQKADSEAALLPQEQSSCCIVPPYHKYPVHAIHLPTATAQRQEEAIPPPQVLPSPHSPLLSEHADDATDVTPEIFEEEGVTAACMLRGFCFDEGRTLADGLLWECEEALKKAPLPSTAEAASVSAATCPSLHTSSLASFAGISAATATTATATARRRLLQQVSLVLSSNACLAAASTPLLLKGKRSTAAAAAAAGAAPPKVRAPPPATSRSRTSNARKSEQPDREGASKRVSSLTTPSKRSRSGSTSIKSRRGSNSANRSSLRLLRRQEAAAAAETAAAAAAAIRSASNSAKKQRQQQQQQLEQQHAQLECLLQDLQRETAQIWSCDEEQPELAALPPEEAAEGIPGFLLDSLCV